MDNDVAANVFMPSIAEHELKVFKYYGGEDKLLPEENTAGFRDHSEFKRFLEERNKKVKDFRQSVMHIHNKKQDNWLKVRESKVEEARDAEGKAKAQE